jgi:hypothetical protein
VVDTAKPRLERIGNLQRCCKCTYVPPRAVLGASAPPRGTAALASSTDPKTAQRLGGPEHLDAHAGANWHMIPRPDDLQRMETAERALLG